MELYNSYLEVDLGAIKRNVERVRGGINPKVGIISVLKGNAYGAVNVTVGKYLFEKCGADHFGCSSVLEAVQLRQVGVDKFILVMGGVPYHNIDAVVEYDLHTPAFHEEYLSLLENAAAKAGKTVSVHIKVETGLNRIGVKPGPDLERICLFLKTLKHVKVRGIFTHFTQSGVPDKTVTYEELGRFKTGFEQAKGHGFTFDYIHVQNSGAVPWLTFEHETHVRPGAIIYGSDNDFDENVHSKNRFGLEEVMTWRAFVTNVKTVQAGEAVGYDGHFKVTKTMDVATVSVGYADGYTRTLGNSLKGVMLVNGKRATVIGICMDQAFLDVSGIDVKINDAVTILGRDGDEFLSVMDLQRQMNQTYLAAISVIPQRVARMYKE